MEVWAIRVLISWIVFTGLPDVQSKVNLAEFELVKGNGKSLGDNKLAKIFDGKPRTCVRIYGSLSVTFATRALTRINIVVQPRNITLTVDGANLHEDCWCETRPVTGKKFNSTSINFNCPLQTSASLQLFGVERLCDVKLDNKSGAVDKQMKCTEWNQRNELTTQKQERSTAAPDPCSSGSFKCQNGTCSIVNNSPLCQCYDGSTGYHCDKVCDPGTFGANCSGTCGEGCVNATCDVQHGTCSCLPGWKGSKCDTVDIPCADGCVNATCDVKDGTCSCLLGWNGSRCDTACGPGTFGLDCGMMCADGCVNGTCDVKNGTCSCLPGWNGSRCDTGCNRVIGTTVLTNQDDGAD